MDSQDTIVALTTPVGFSAVAVIRLSGKNAFVIGEKFLHFGPKNRFAHFAKIFDEKGNILDECIAIFFKEPNSFTGEDVFEIQCHGSPIVIDEIMKTALFYGARMAKPGEFSRRAFLNGKISLEKTEAISDLISASSERAAKSALLVLTGEFSEKIGQIKEELINLRVEVEASLDFSEEEIPLVENSAIISRIKEVIAQIEALTANVECGILLREGFKIAILGKPNVGKSSLLNALTKNETAIVSNIAGTTRDAIKENILIYGIPVTLVDTAGIQATTDMIEKEGIKKSFQNAKEADVILYLVDNDEDAKLTNYPFSREKTIVVRNKIDIFPSKLLTGAVLISALQKTGVDNLLPKIAEKIGLDLNIKNEEGIFIARRRHFEALKKTEQFLAKALLNPSPEIMAYELQLAQNALGEIVGEFYEDDLLDRIFSTFCIGK